MKTKRIVLIFLISFCAFIISSKIIAQSWSSGTGKLYTNPNTTKVGIGANSPQALLHILKNPGSSNGKGLLFGYIGNDIQGRYGNTGQFNGDLILNYWAGNVGIATNTPEEKLHVHNGNFKMTKNGYEDLYFKLELEETEGDNILHFNTNVPVIEFYSSYNGGFYPIVKTGSIRATSTYCYFHLSDGFEIRNKNPYEIVAYISKEGNATFAGKVTANEIEVKADVWADYVFDQNYDLLSVNELKNYIKTNKSLPDIPTEEEIKEKGLNLGNMDALLLKKIEEQALYIIQLDNKIKELEAKIID